MPAKLFLVSGARAEPDPPFTLPPSSRVVVGRGSDANFILLDEQASRAHFAIFHDGNEYLLEDLGSANGTYLNNERVHTIIPLQHEDVIRAGHTLLRFSLPTEDTPARHLAEGEAATGSSVIERPPEGGAPIVRVSLTPVEGGPTGPRPGFFLPCRWWNLPFQLLLIPLRILLFPITEFRRARWDRRFGLAHPDHTVRNFAARHPNEAANRVVAWYQKLWYIALLFAALWLLDYHVLRFLHVLHLFCALYLIVILYKLVAVVLSLLTAGEIKVTPEEIAALKDDELPTYTILVPLYHETEVASKIIRYIRRLDYPQDKLDVKLLLEADDRGTLEVCRQAKLPENYELVVVPDCKPKTKPKACNHGLERAKGEYLVIYDAEDRPEHDQLKKAIVAFRRANTPRGFISRIFRRSRTVCLQAKLNYYNTDQNLLTKWFTMEYSTWFDLFLPGLHRLGSPIPLGGTSNHFQTDVLKAIGGWDPFNVAEDCDLGIRLHKMGYRTQVLDSTTWEEANSRLWNWVRQRSRWVKGYIQTHLVHMRNPFKAVWRLGFAGTFGFLTSVGGLSLMLILNPIFWTLLLFYGACWVHDLALSGWSWEATRAFQATFQPGEWPWDRWLNWDGPWVWQMWFDDPRGNPFWNTWSQVFFFITVALFLANFLFILMHVWACIRRGHYRLIPHAIFSPFYWVLISLGAWKGFLQLFWNPFKWEKTMHGLDASAKSREGGAP